MQADIKEWLKSTRPTIIFGAGRQGAVLYEFCKMYQKPCIAIMTSGSRTRWGSLPEEDVVPHATPGSYAGDKQNVDIVVAIGGDISGIVATLLESGYKNIFVSDDWNVSNDNLLRNFYESYVCARGGTYVEIQKINPTGIIRMKILVLKFTIRLMRFMMPHF